MVSLPHESTMAIVDAVAVVAGRVERTDVVRGLDRLGREARTPDRLAIGLGRRRGASRDELEVAYGRMRYRQRR